VVAGARPHIFVARTPPRHCELARGSNDTVCMASERGNGPCLEGVQCHECKSVSLTCMAGVWHFESAQDAHVNNVYPFGGAAVSTGTFGRHGIVRRVPRCSYLVVAP
jgi:hypothetical protein